MHKTSMKGVFISTYMGVGKDLHPGMPLRFPHRTLQQSLYRFVTVMHEFRYNLMSMTAQIQDACVAKAPMTSLACDWVRGDLHYLLGSSNC